MFGGVSPSGQRLLDAWSTSDGRTWTIYDLEEDVLRLPAADATCDLCDSGFASVASPGCSHCGGSSKMSGELLDTLLLLVHVHGVLSTSVC
jgi:hypothetical protein